MNNLAPLEVWIKYAPHPVPVLFLQQDENKMRNRLKPFKQIETKGLYSILHVLWAKYVYK